MAEPAHLPALPACCWVVFLSLYQLMTEGWPLGPWTCELLLPWVFASGWGIFEGLSIGSVPKLGFHNEIAEGSVHICRRER